MENEAIKGMGSLEGSKCPQELSKRPITKKLEPPMARHGGTDPAVGIRCPYSREHRGSDSECKKDRVRSNEKDPRGGTWNQQRKVDLDGRMEHN